MRMHGARWQWLKKCPRLWANVTSRSIIRTQRRLAAALKSVLDGFGIGVFELTSCGGPSAQRSDMYRGVASIYFFADADGSRVAFGIGGKGEDYLVEAGLHAVGKRGEQLFDAQTACFFRCERDGTAEDEVLSAIGAATL